MINGREYVKLPTNTTGIPPMKRKLIFCKTKVKASGIRREIREGVEHIIITSFTLPPDIVMNGGLYPAEEINKSFHTLERTLAPIEHPEVNGQFISAIDPLAIHNFHGGVWNENVHQIDDGRIQIDKVVNVIEANKTEKGKRLLDRVSAIEEGSDSRSIHTSVGVYLDPELLGEVRTNDAGDKFDWIARDMLFDHDAILLDSTGAATPSKGVGIGINKEKVDVEFVTCDKKEIILKPQKIRPEADDLRTFKNFKAGNDISFTRNEHEISFDQIHTMLFDHLNQGIIDFDKKSWIIAVFDTTFIYETPSGELFRSNYSIDANGNLEISDTRLPVEKVIEFRPINPPDNSEDDVMRDTIIAELKKLGISVNADISDADLLAKHAEATLAANTGSDDVDIKPNQELIDTVGKQAEQIDSLTKTIQANADADLDKKIIAIKANTRYKDMTDGALKAIHANSAEDFELMYTNSIPSIGIGHTTNLSADDENEFILNTETKDLPE